MGLLIVGTAFLGVLISTKEDILLIYNSSINSKSESNFEHDVINNKPETIIKYLRFFMIQTKFKKLIKISPAKLTNKVLQWGVLLFIKEGVLFIINNKDDKM